MTEGDPTDNRPTILIVDDDVPFRRESRHILERAGYRCDEAASAAAASEHIAEHRCDAIILDIFMPNESGIEFVGSLLGGDRQIAVLMASRADDRDIAELAIRRGAYGYLIKPFTPNELVIAVTNALSRLTLEREARAQRDKLTREVEERTANLQARVSELRESRLETVQCLAKAVALCDLDTDVHIERVGALSAILAKEIGWSDADAELLRVASPMHDVGKIALPDIILRKPGALTDDERLIMQRHTEIGHAILSESHGELLQMAATIALTHHERYDGAGYPRGLAGEEIPMEGRIVAVVDVFDALLNDRAYRPALPPTKAAESMRSDHGHFDTAVLDVLFDNFDRFVQIAGTGNEEPMALDPHDPPRID